MRLINTTTMQLEDFMANPPPYAILSHTWEDGEVSFQDFTSPDHSVASCKKGFSKIQSTCLQAKQTGLSHAWVDTCCIDKTSSAELSEAINSMFAWYLGSEICYTFLPDLGPGDAVDLGSTASELARCRWFTRGWTLQELIAPTAIEFYDAKWTLRGTKHSLSTILETITGIDGQVLRDSTLLADVPVARRMSWAAKRTTTRVEDMAYCLLGIFNISMPMLYGEGEKAFIRLQEEIARETNDLSLFAWQASPATDAGFQKYRGVLATSPAEFLNAGTIVAGDDARFNEEFVMTNKGLRIKSGLGAGSDGTYVMNLNCSLQKNPTQQIGIHLTLHGAWVYARDHPDKLVVQSQWQLMGPQTIYISKGLTSHQSVALDTKNRNAFFFRSGIINPVFRPKTMVPAELWDGQHRLFLTHGMASFTGAIMFDIHEAVKIRSPGFMVVVGTTTEEGRNEPRPWVVVGDVARYPQLITNLRALPKLGEVASQIESKSIVMSNKFVVSVAVEQAVVDGVQMYCVDLKFEDLTGKTCDRTLEQRPVFATGRMV